ncbi:hypothetical protein HY405_00235 [Candidatus Microgenomates bacterium]|nr:hypothetical protein [Candidatus Microgenomates bacterium]
MNDSNENNAPKKRRNFSVILGSVMSLLLIVVAYWIGGQNQPKIPPPLNPPQRGSTPTQPVVTASPTPTPIRIPRLTATTTPVPSPTPTQAPFNVTNVTAAVAPISSNTCPTTFKFAATIVANAAGKVIYKWESSVGDTSPFPQTIEFSGSGSRSVTDEWFITKSYSGWKQVHILEPNDVISNQATFTLTCP